jgi:hypothetical protein
MRGIPVDVLPDAANLDAEFRIAARFWDCTLRLDEGERAHTIRIEGGRITSIEPAGAEETFDLLIAAAPEKWDQLLASVPRPFFQDLYGAATHHGFQLGGNLEHHLFPYYPAVRRLLEILRSATS